jgi:hydroxymethylpyrimidine/phosphomethylpyrimidine kinase
MKNILTFAGSDPSGGAGIQLDLKVFQRLGVRGLSVINTVTAQNTKRITSVFPIPSKVISKQLSALSETFRIDAVKTGMIFEKEAVRVLSGFVKRHKIAHLVVDPVIISSTGKLLMKRSAMYCLMEELLPITEVITPNLKEAEMLTGIKITDRKSALRAAERLRLSGCRYVVLTGGDVGDRWVRDYLYDGEELYTFRTRKFPDRYHGTGCCFSAALTVFIAEGCAIRDAVAMARRFVHTAIKKSNRIDDGLRLLGV